MHNPIADHWKRREQETNDRAWAAFLAALQRGHTFDDSLDAVQVVFGLMAAETCRRRAEEILRKEGEK